jgi:hypothetical protein
VAEYGDAVAIARGWPEVTESLSYGTPALKVRGKLFCRLWGERDFAKASVHDSDVIVLFCDLAVKDALIADSDGSVFSAPHYDGHPTVLVRLSTISLDELSSLLRESYRLKAPPPRRAPHTR